MERGVKAASASAVFHTWKDVDGIWQTAALPEPQSPTAAETEHQE